MVFNIGNRSYTTSELNKKLKDSEPTFKNWSGARKISLGSEAFKFNEILDAVGTTIKNQKESGQVFSNNDEVHSILERLVELKDQGHEKTGILYNLFRRFFPNLGRDRKIESLKSTIESAFPKAASVKKYVVEKQSEFTKETESQIVNRADKELSIYDAAQLINYYLGNNLIDKLNQLLSRLSPAVIQNLYKIFTESLVLTEILAGQGFAAAQFNLGMMYEQGKGGLKKSDNEAVKWYVKAAEQGHAGAQNNLGIRCGLGQGVEKDEKKSFEYFELAAEHGDSEALCNLGAMYLDGLYVSQDEEKALEYFDLAVKEGVVHAQFALGVMYEHGRGGLSQNNEEALRCYKLAVQQGSEAARSAIDKLNKKLNL